MEKSQPHVVIFPFPLQGHIKPLLCLAELLCHAGLHVTFVNTHNNHNRLSNLSALSTHFPTLHFESITDGLPEDHPHALGSELLIALKTSIKPHFKELLQSSLKADGVVLPPPTCIITDGLVTFAFDVADELGLPILSYNVPFARYLWTCLCLPKLIQEGQIPFQDDDMNVEITGVPGMEGLLQRSDLPGFCRVKQSNHPNLQFAINESQTQKRASAVIFDTVYELDEPCLSHMAHMFRKIYTLGPLHSLLHSRIGDVARSLSSHGGLLKGDLNCMKWLNSQPSNPFFIKTVCEKWKIGLQLKENCDRNDIENVIRSLMEFKKEEIQSSMDTVLKVVRDSVAKGGSSSRNLELLIQDIRNMHARPQ
ncbi:hypothetical protein M0R45_025845 [Rubus argutus]|uniref:Uncharacterized protein n=1 Tax=Rubus argutus TaxID=59490 RepID=A0AAW1WWH2_RUBAR